MNHSGAAAALLNYAVAAHCIKKASALERHERSIGSRLNAVSVPHMFQDSAARYLFGAQRPAGQARRQRRLIQSRICQKEIGGGQQYSSRCKCFMFRKEMDGG